MGKEGCAKIAKSFQFSNSNSGTSNYILVLLWDPNFISEFDSWFTVNEKYVLGLRNAYVPVWCLEIMSITKIESSDRDWCFYGKDQISIRFRISRLEFYLIIEGFSWSTFNPFMLKEESYQAWIRFYRADEKTEIVSWECNHVIGQKNFIFKIYAPSWVFWPITCLRSQFSLLAQRTNIFKICS